MSVTGMGLVWWSAAAVTPSKPTAAHPAVAASPSATPSPVEHVSRAKRPIHPASPYTAQQLELASATDIPVRALVAYQHAAAAERKARPSCHIEWQFIAAFGRIETNHGRLNGSAIGSDGVDRPAVYGPNLDGSEPGVIGSLNDSSGVPVRAAGPLQFIPATWQQWGHGDVQNIDAAATAAGSYLCADGHTLSNDDDRRNAALSYNHTDWYADDVMAIYHDYENSQPANSFPVTPGGDGSQAAPAISAGVSAAPVSVAPMANPVPVSSAPAPSSQPPASSSAPPPPPPASSSTASLPLPTKR